MMDWHTMSSTDRALTCVDILDEVFERVIRMDDAKADSDHRHHVGRRALAHCARVCKVFFKPAVRVLWARLDSVLPLFHTLPSLKSYDRNVRPRRTYHLPDQVASYEWDRLRTYAVYVKNICVGKAPCARTESFTRASWTSLQRLAHNQPICPNLRHLSWGMDEAPPDDLITFLGPSIVALRITCFAGRFTLDEYSWQVHLRILFRAVSERATRLQGLWIFLGDVMTPSQVTIPLSQISLPALRSCLLRCGKVTFSDLVMLSGVAALESLELTLDNGILQSEDIHCSLEFQRLHTLWVRHLPTSISASISLFKCSPIRSLYVHGIEYRDPAALKRMFEAWSYDFPSLQLLSCKICMPNIPVRPAGLLSSFLAPSLRNLSGLRAVDLYLGGIPGLTIDDSDIVMLSELWPLLKQLRLWAAKDETAGHTYGLLSLAALAKNCPHLEDLLLQRIVIRPEDTARLPTGLPLHGLRSLQVSPPNRIARHDYVTIRERIFPHLPHPREEDMEELSGLAHASELPMNVG
ncbi:hypothetical protein C8Q70DRAFT_543168 [Cubamyces menziesii]|nr:hypothetical protein C8Q70DRAFT_543168 [Cubamyces menziesii]